MQVFKTTDYVTTNQNEFKCHFKKPTKQKREKRRAELVLLKLPEVSSVALFLGSRLVFSALPIISKSPASPIHEKKGQSENMPLRSKVSRGWEGSQLSSTAKFTMLVSRKFRVSPSKAQKNGKEISNKEVKPCISGSCAHTTG